MNARSPLELNSAEFPGSKTPSIESFDPRELRSSVVRLRFPKSVEQAFHADYWMSTIATTRTAMTLAAALYAVFGILDFWAVPISRSKIWVIRYGIVCPGLVAVTLLTFFSRWRNLVQPALCFASILAGLGNVFMIASVHPNELGYHYYFVGLILCMMFIYALLRQRFWYAIFANATIVAAFEVLSLSRHDLSVENDFALFLTEQYFILAATVIGVATCYFLESYSRHDFVQRWMISKERMKSDQLLLNMLPGSIANRLKNEPGTIADAFDSISVLFADIENFTPLSEAIPADRVVNILNDLFSHFDSLTESFGVEKIKTIGDCYMVASGAPHPREDHAQVLARLAVEMRDHVSRMPAVHGWRLGIRIGISSGPVVAGVIGHKKYITSIRI